MSRPPGRSKSEQIIRAVAAEAAVAALIDHTLLRADAKQAEIEKLCREAAQYGFAAVCVNPCYVSLASERTRGTGVKVCTVAGFPLGAALPQVKIFEAQEAIKLGAREIDMVQNIGALKSGNMEQVEADLRGVVETCQRGGAVCKVILEMGLLTKEEKIRGALLAKHAGADFVKTSTGFSSGGATARDVALLRAILIKNAGAKEMGIKAAGGIRSLEDLERMVNAGATRVGTSAGVRIMEQARSRFSS